MKKIVILWLMVFSQTAFADSCAPNKTIKDYFLSVPAEMLSIYDDEKGPLTTTKSRESAIAIIDKKNGFIALQNNTILSAIEIALYRTADRKPVLMVTEDGVSVQNTYAFNCYGGQWHDVSSTLFPKKSIKSIVDLYKAANIKVNGQFLTENELAMVAHSVLRYRLPKNGKRIQVVASHPEIDSKTHTHLYSYTPAIKQLNWK
jgi:hypothetical protein